MHSSFAYALWLNLEREECELSSYLVMICTYTKDKILGWTLTLRSMVNIRKHSLAKNQFIIR